MVSILDALLEELYEFIDAAEGGFMSAFAAILFGREHIDQLGAAQDKGLELLGLLVVQGPHLGLDGGAVVGNDTCIDAIGLGQPSSGLGEIAHPFWIDRDAGQAGLAQGLEGRFELAGGFEHDPLGFERDQFRDQGGDTVGRIGARKYSLLS